MKTITDSKSFTISIVEHGNVSISNFQAPTLGYVDEEQVISFDLTNNGGLDTIFISLVDDQGQSLHEETFTMDAGATRDCIVTKTFDAPDVWNLILNVGYQTQ